jgi:hypothetical protein
MTMTLTELYPSFEFLHICLMDYIDFQDYKDNFERMGVDRLMVVDVLQNYKPVVPMN